jgi:hypothetical protein
MTGILRIHFIYSSPPFCHSVPVTLPGCCVTPVVSPGGHVHNYQPFATLTDRNGVFLNALYFNFLCVRSEASVLRWSEKYVGLSGIWNVSFLLVFYGLPQKNINVNTKTSLLMLLWEWWLIILRIIRNTPILWAQFRVF